MSKRAPIFIIAEAGVNHNGRLDVAERLIDEACNAGADAIKFQLFHAEDVVTEIAQKAEYQRNASDQEETQYTMLKRLELDEYEMKHLYGRCVERNILFLASAFSIHCLDVLSDIGVSTFKIPSGEITNLPYLRHVAKLAQKIILSTGMSTLEEIGAALNVLAGAGAAMSDIVVLHCNTEYPTPEEDVNLRAMDVIRSEFCVPVGYSDHTIGIDVAINAAARGAVVIEKHFTLDRSLSGPDHAASVEPAELKCLVDSVRKVERILGACQKVPSKSEQKNVAIVRRSIVAMRDIECGETFNESNITAKRPGTGLSPMLWDSVIGRAAKRKFQKDEMIEI